MPSTASSYHPPNVVLDDEEPSAVAEPLLGEHRTDGNHQQGNPESNTASDAPQDTNDAQSRTEASTRQSQMPTFQPTAGLDMTSLPDGIASWREQRGIQIVWLLSSIFMVVLDVAGLDIGFLAGLLGICGASLAVCNCCQFTDLRGIVRAIRFLGYLTFSISAIIGLLLLGALNGWECNELHDIEDCKNVKYLVLFLGAWHGWHAALSFMVAQRATKVKQLLDPISSGMMIL